MSEVIFCKKKPHLSVGLSKLLKLSSVPAILGLHPEETKVGVAVPAKVHLIRGSGVNMFVHDPVEGLGLCAVNEREDGAVQDAGGDVALTVYGDDEHEGGCSRDGQD